MNVQGLTNSRHENIYIDGTARGYFADFAPLAAAQLWSTRNRPICIFMHGRFGANVRICRNQPPTAPDRMNAKTRGKMWQNSPPPQESTSPPARSIASQRGCADRTKSSAVAASTSSAAHTSATISRREPAGKSASESRSTVKCYASCCIRPHLPHGVRASQAQGKITPAGLAS